MLAGTSTPTTIGSSQMPDRSVTSQLCDRAGGCTVSQTSLPGRRVTAPEDGRLTSWQVQAFDGEVSLKVIRGVGAQSRVVGTTQDQTAPDGTLHTFSISPPLAILAGDRIGAQVYREGKFGFFLNPDARTDTWDPALGTTPAAPTSVDLDGYEILLSATFLPGLPPVARTRVSIRSILAARPGPRSRSRRQVLFSFRVVNRGTARTRGLRTCITLPGGFRFDYMRRHLPRNASISGRRLCARAGIRAGSRRTYVVQASTPRRAGTYHVRLSARGSNLGTVRRTVHVRVRPR